MSTASPQSSQTLVTVPRAGRAGFVAALGSLLVGYDTGVISGAILFIQKDFSLSPFQQGLVITSLLVGAVVGSIVAGWFAQRFGRRTTLLATCALFVVSAILMAIAPPRRSMYVGAMAIRIAETTKRAILMAIAPTYMLLLGGRVLAGLAVGSMEATVPTFLAELSPAGTRGRIGSSNQLMIATGILIAAIVNYFFSQDLSWRVSLGAAALPALVILIALLRVPETPRWLMLRGRTDEARTALAALLSPKEANIAFEELRTARDDEQHTSAGRTSTLNVFRAPALRWILLAAVFLAMSQQLIGINSIVYYAPTILTAVGFGTSAALLNSIGFGVLSVIMTLLSSRVVDRTGRRSLLIFGAILLGVSMLGVGAVFAFGLLGTSFGQYLALISLAVFKAGYSFTWGPVVWIVLPELFPLGARAAGVSISTAAKLAITVLLTLFFPLFLLAGAGGIFFIFAAFAAIAAVFVWRKIPETGRRTLEELTDTTSTPVALRTGKGNR